MNYELLFQRPADKIIKTALIGAGEFGASYLFQGLRCPGLSVSAVATRTVERAVDGYVAAGIDRVEVVVCDSEAKVKQAFEAGKYVVAADPDLLMGLPLDVLVEGSGHPEFGARTAETALDHGISVVMVSKECDSVVGPILHRKARANGLVYTTGEGDQPSLLIGLITWARVIGLKIVAAGKSSEYDFVWDRPAGRVISNNVAAPAAGLEDLWLLGDRSAVDVAAARSELLAGLSQCAVPDLCEMGVVANATGLKPDRPDFHHPIARTNEISELMRLKDDGGLLAREGAVDIVNHLRLPDEASLAGGVYVVLECQDKAAWPVLAAKGHPVSRDGKHVMIHHPAHLLGVESPVSVLAAALLKAPTGGAELKPICDLICIADRDFKAGETLTMGGHHHVIDGAKANLVDAVGNGPEDPAPFYLVSNRKLVRDVSAGRAVVWSDVELPEDSPLVRLRREQGKAFGPA